MKKLRFKRFLALCLSFALLFGMFPAVAAAGDSVSISTAEELIALLNTSPSEAGQTEGKTYVLADDIEIDTSALETGFSSSANRSKRIFKGVLDGNNHTVTVKENENAASQPLFDFLEGSDTQRAGVKNLKLVFQGDVKGTTIAALVSYVDIENVSVEFQKNILFASDGYISIATGVYGRMINGSPNILKTVSVKGSPEPSCGVIGSDSPENVPYVMAAGLYTEWNFAGGINLCNGVKVDVQNIRAAADYSGPQEDSACNAAGLISGYYQTNSRVANAEVKVSGSISAATTENSKNTDVAAYGLGYDLLAMYNCRVDIGGNIEADGYANVYAAGMGHEIQTKYNKKSFDYEDSGNSYVKVQGDIMAVSNGAAKDKKAVACGIACYSGQEATWKNVSAEAEKIKAEATGLCDAYAVGFVYQQMHTGNQTTDDFDYMNCSVKASEISANSAVYGGYALGFSMWGYASFLNCSVETERLAADGADAAAAGFAYCFAPNTALWRDNHGEMDGCNVKAGSITAVHTEPSYGAVAAGLLCAAQDNNKLGITGTIRNCTAEITGEFSADGEQADKGLLIGWGDNYDVVDNTVKLQRQYADVVDIEGEEYAAFSLSETDGRAGATPEDTDWESGNKLFFIDDSENNVFCRFDDGDKGKDGTLWKLTDKVSYFSVDYDLADGTGAEGVDYSRQAVKENETVVVKEAPVKAGYTFVGWSDGTEIYQPGKMLTVSGSITLTAQWKKQGGGNTYYTLNYESNGGTEYAAERCKRGSVVSLDKTPIRENYTFTGWYADSDLTEKITQVTMNSAKTVYAGWKKTAVPSFLNGTDHFAYIIGYDNGLVYPENNITRAEVATIFFRLLEDSVRADNMTDVNGFSDVKADNWFNRACSTMAKIGVLQGCPDGSFEPGRPITRAEFAAICARFDDGETSGKAIFTDISGHWAEQEIIRASERGWVTGYTDGTFLPNKYITRAEAMAMVNRVLSRNPETPADLLNGMNIWPDNTDTEKWYYLAVQEATNSHDYEAKDQTYERWTKMKADPDWLQYEKDQ